MALIRALENYRVQAYDPAVRLAPEEFPHVQTATSPLEAVEGTDVLVMDAQYDWEEYQSHVGWGHGCVDEVVALALQAGIKQLFLFHHDPDHPDACIDGIVKEARNYYPKVRAASEGMEIQL